MNTFKRKSLYAALAGVGALGVTGAAQAVNVNPDGLGQVLIYPYYTTQGDERRRTTRCCRSSTRRIPARSSRSVSWKARTAKEVLDFNLFLSPHDVWTAAIIPMRSRAPASSPPTSPARRRRFRLPASLSSTSRTVGRRSRHGPRPDQGRLRRNHRDGQPDRCDADGDHARPAGASRKAARMRGSAGRNRSRPISSPGTADCSAASR